MTLLLALILTLVSVASAAAQGRLKVILDTDIGGDIDDAWALGMTLSEERFELLGVTVSDGDTATRAKVACKILHLVGRSELPVAVGRQTKGDPNHINYQFGWAEDFTAKKPIAQSAADFIVEVARKFPGEVTLMAVGPLQNVADALRKEPKLGQLLKRVVLMSGNIHSSEWGPAPRPEWNVVAATKDSQVVYGAGLPLTIVPLDSTTYVEMVHDEREKVRKHRTPLTQALEGLYRLWLPHPNWQMTLHDQLAIGETAAPGQFFAKLETLKLIVDDEGYTRIDEKRGKPVTVCFWPKRDEFMKYYVDLLTKQRLNSR
jgi:purine nucleosidase